MGKTTRVWLLMAGILAAATPRAFAASSFGDDGSPVTTPSKQAKSNSSDSINSLAFKYSPTWIEGAQNQGAQVSPAPNSAGRGRPQTGGGRGGDDLYSLRTGLKILPYGLPVCFLEDAQTPPKKVDEKIKAMVEVYAKCGVAILPYIYTLTDNYPKDATALGQAARQACNFNEKFGMRGAVQIDTLNAQLPQQMCNDPKATGCSSLCEQTSFSIVGPGAGVGVGLHESGHSNCCGRLCVNKGLGIEPAGNGLDLVFNTRSIDDKPKFHAEEGADIQASPFSPGACESIRAGAATRPEGYQDLRGQLQFYYPAGPGKQKDITIGRSILEDGPNGGRGVASYGEGQPAGEQININAAPGSEGLLMLAGVNPQQLHQTAPIAAPDANQTYANAVAGLGGAAEGVGGGAAVDNDSPKQLLYDEGAPKNGSKGGGADSSSVAATMLPGAETETDTNAAGGRTTLMDEGAPKGAASISSGPAVANGPLTGTPKGQITNETRIYAAKGGKASAKTKRQRGASFKRSHYFSVKDNNLISTRPAPDFAVSPGQGDAEGGGD